MEGPLTGNLDVVGKSKSPASRVTQGDGYRHNLCADPLDKLSDTLLLIRACSVADTSVLCVINSLNLLNNPMKQAVYSYLQCLCKLVQAGPTKGARV